MIAISKEEKEAICAKYPAARFVRTMRQRSSRHRYYMEEMPEPMRLLRSLRGQTGKRKGV